ncbi:MAG: ATP-binding protein [Campylobacter sp.]|nr:ATP-binding protein [Campylobacter sp.]
MKALALFSGGLDSMLAIKLITEQDIEVTALYVDIGFGSREDKDKILRLRAKEVGANFEVIDIRNSYLQKVLLSPKYGYGKHFNPCIDCHGYMFRIALDMLKHKGASFIITGEVLGQRPMSQRKEALKNVLSLSGDEDDLILRPLSAKLLKPTKPEIEGWVDREALLDISGRNRERQLAMAKEYGFCEYESPGGGCLLTIQSYSDKLKDALAYEGLDKPCDTEILKFGRHLRLDEGAKLIIGRDEKDNLKLEGVENPKFSKVILPQDLIGPYALISKNASKQDKIEAIKLVLTYAKTILNKEYKVVLEGDEFIQIPYNSKSVASRYFVG